MVSNHYDKKRKKRQKLINKYVHGDGNVIDSFVVDKKHVNGAEIHSITDTGLIIIHNQQTGKLITKLVARPQQIKRYYINSGREPPEWLLELAEWHKQLGYNRG